MAANVLKAAGHEIIVLESRDRIGGRINTNKDWGVTLELGANWISYASDPLNPLVDLKEKVGLQTKQTPYASVKVYDKYGDSISKIALGLKGLKADKRSLEYFNTNKKDISLGEVIDIVMNYEDISERKQAQLDIVKLGYSASAGRDSYEISGRGYLTYLNDLEEDEQLVMNGYNQVVHHLLQNSTIKTNQKVVEIIDKEREVQVVTDKGVFEADYVILTTPISLLQQEKIKFSPTLPDYKKASFQKMPMGIFNKAIMQFTEKFWKGTPHFLAFQKETQKNSGIVLNYHAYEGKPILIAFHVGESGKWLESVSNQAIQDHWRETFHKAFPNREIEFERMMTSNWLNDPHSKGSYSCLGIGTTESDVQQIAEPVGRIHFAGEATTYRGHGYVHGALESGIREANRIMQY